MNLVDVYVVKVIVPAKKINDFSWTKKSNDRLLR